MERSGPLDSAPALARTPLFAQLGRVDLAKLAGELEELRFAVGRPIVREGDKPDGFYVIKSGEVRVVTGAQPADGSASIRLGPGEGFGEIALLSDSPRTASVFAHTDVTVWRLSRARFEELLGRERSIALSIERALSRRLAATTHEAADLRAAGRLLAAGLTRDLSPEARRLLAGVALRARWPLAVLERACQRAGLAQGLDALRAVPGLLAVDGDTLVVDGTVAGLVAEAVPAGGEAAAAPAGAGWLRIAAEELAAAGDPVGALDLVLAAGDREAFAGLLAAADSRLREVPPIEALDRWLARLGPADAALSARLAALRPAVRGRSAAARVAVLGPSTPAGTPRAPRRRLVQGLGALAAVGLFALGYALPEPAGLERAGLVTLAAIVATVPLLVFDILPDYAVMLLFAVALVVPGHVPPPDILAGFATPAWLMILTLLAVGTAVSRSGLMFRLVLLSLERLPPRYGVQSLVLAGTGVLLTAGITSGATRIALGVSIARGMADAMGFAPQSRGAAAIGLLTFFTFSQMGTLFLTGTFTCLVLHDLLPTAARREVTWWYWLGVAVVPIAIIFALVYVATLVTFRPQREVRVNLEAVRVQRELLGPVAYEEVWSAVALAVLIVGFATREYHGIGPAWLAVLVFLLLFALGVLDRTALQTGGTLGLLVYSGVILSLGGVFTTLGIDTWLASVVRSGLPPIVANPYGFVLSVALIAFALHFFVPWITASTILALVTMPVAEALGFHPFVAVLVTLIAGDHTLFPFVNPAYPILYFASEGALFTHAQARPLLWLETGFRLVALLLSVPVWRLFGLM